MSDIIKEMGGVPGLTLKHATTKHARVIGMLERFHASIKQAFKIETGGRRSFWHKYVTIAVLNYNTFYQASIGFETSRVFRVRIVLICARYKIGHSSAKKCSVQLHKLPKLFLNRVK